MPTPPRSKKPPTRSPIPTDVASLVEIRINGRLRFSGEVFGPVFDDADGANVVFRAATQPTLTETPPAPRHDAATMEVDEREGEETLLKIHDGKRT